MLLSVIDFIRENLSWILSLCAIVVGICFALLKKRPIAIDFFNIALITLARCGAMGVLIAEGKSDSLSGSDKKKIAMDFLFNNYFQIIEEKSLSDVQLAKVRDLFDSSIELILSTPRKKGIPKNG